MFLQIIYELSRSFENIVVLPMLNLINNETFDFFVIS